MGQTGSDNNGTNNGTNKVPNNNIMNLNQQQMWNAFNQLNQQNQMQQIYIQQQYNLYQQFCLTNALNPSDYNSFLKYNNYINGNMMMPQTPQTPINNLPNNNLYQYGFSNNLYNINNGYTNPNLYNNNLNNNVYNNNSNFYNNGYNINYPSSNSSNSTNNSDVYVKGDLSPVLPRKDTPDYVTANGSNMMNITIESSAHYVMHLVLPGNTTINGMFKKYLDRLSLPYSHLGKDLVFLYNGKKVDPFSQLTIFPTLKNNIVITVFDQGGVIGAKIK